MGRSVMILAGGTGGHVYPALAVAQALSELGHRVTWMGTRSGLEARVVPEAKIPVEWLSVNGIRGKGWRKRIMAPLMLLRASLQAGSILQRVRPDVVLGMGGFVSGPGGMMAKMLGIPLVVHEQNRVPGTTNRLLARWADRILEAFPKSFPDRLGAEWTGNPLRTEFLKGIDTPLEKSRSAFHILVVGGSLGARALNEVVPSSMAMVSGHSLKILHQTGDAMVLETRQSYAQHGLMAEVRPYIEDMAAAYAWADLVICRAGAMSISELSATGTPSILVPFPHAIDDHQTENARYLAEAGAAILMPQTELCADSLSKLVESLLGSTDRMADMGLCALRLARVDATRAVARICLETTQASRGKPSQP